MGHRNTDTSITLLVAMKRVKRRMRVLLDTGSQWASCMVKRMAPYRLALVGLQTRKLYRQRMFVMMCTVCKTILTTIQYSILFYSIPVYLSSFVQDWRPKGQTKIYSVLFYSNPILIYLLIVIFTALKSADVHGHYLNALFFIHRSNVFSYDK